MFLSQHFLSIPLLLKLLLQLRLLPSHQLHFLLLRLQNLLDLILLSPLLILLFLLLLEPVFQLARLLFNH